MNNQNQENSNLSNLSNGFSAIAQSINEYNFDINSIFEKTKHLGLVANRTNLLAINASIETIHASDLLASFEKIVAQHLLTQAKIISMILENDPDFIFEDGSAFTKKYGIEELFITDEKGIIIFTNINAWKNSKLNSKEALAILDNKDLTVTMASAPHGLEGERLKSVAISRQGNKGIIKISSGFTIPTGQLAIDGFGVVTKEAKRLADLSKLSYIETVDLTEKIQDEISELNIISKKGLSCFDDSVSFNESKDELINGLTELKTSLKRISSPLASLINIGRQTNLLGVRAAIEAAHSTNDKQDFDSLLNKHLTIEAQLAALLVERIPDVSCDAISGISDYIGIDEFWITDETGTVELTNVPGGKGFVFKDEGQTAAYMRILADPSLIVKALPAMRVLDNKVFKYVGVGRRDKTGIFQIGIASKIYGESTSEGFTVVSNQIKTLAEEFRSLSMEIEELVHQLDKKSQKSIDSIKKLT